MRYKAIVSYDGSQFSGWQCQPDKPSVQDCLEKAISTIADQPVKITGSGRTDSGVHAYGQVFHFDLEKTYRDLKTAINSQLPPTVYIRSVEAVSDDFHSRYDVCWKHYDYLINNGEYDPTRRSYCCFEREKLDIELMAKAAEVFVGTHDFTSFNATGKDEIVNQERTIYNIHVAKEDDMIRLSFYGSGFLRYMVRMIAQTIMEAGKKRITAQEIREMLEKKDKQACHYNGGPQGLYLVEVGYRPYRMQ
ncbi:MAG: tRNA pseudouridine(38-40) synthase TruA [Erysipelotrichaceae bacterium]|nr:tRNA pseudouridine(38-40) synthase TruA [Erysipelotrichaceae bacterium]